MHNITFISTVHEEIGKCNADELCNIIENIKPEVIFLEALNGTYSNDEKFLFSSYGIFNKKLEIKALQKYSGIAPFEYIPVLDYGLSTEFEMRSKLICEYVEYQKLLDNYKDLISEKGFLFLNSSESLKLQDELRKFENEILENSKLHKSVQNEIDEYENCMIRNILAYCKNSQFDRAIFMCGIAHKASIMTKLQKFNIDRDVKLNWRIFDN